MKLKYQKAFLTNLESKLAQVNRDISIANTVIYGKYTTKAAATKWTRTKAQLWQKKKEIQRLISKYGNLHSYS